MKYLMIHKLLWLLVILMLMILNVLYFTVLNIFYFIWSFKFLRWNDIFSDDDEYFGKKSYSDNNPIDTFKRYYKFPN